LTDHSAFRETGVSEQFGAKRIEVRIADHAGFVLMLPSRWESSGSTRWVWYAPHFQGVSPRDIHEWICTRLLAAGMAICGVDVGESYGSPEGRRVFTEFHRAVVGAYGLAGRACLLAQSRGGLMHYNWAVEHPSSVERIGGIYPVCDLSDWPGVEEAYEAYGMTTEELRAQLSEHNPIERLAPLATAKVPVLHVHGDSDSVVPMEKHSAELCRRYRAAGGEMKLVVIAGAEHEEIDAFFKSQQLVDFLVQGPPAVYST
jgi:hypothetical protein